MNKKLVVLVTTGIICAALSGCSGSDNSGTSNEVSEPVVVEEQTEQNVDAEEIEETLIIDFDNKTLSEMKLFIDDNIADASVEQIDEMVLLYDSELREAGKSLFELYYSSPRFGLVNATKDDQYVLHIEDIADATIKEETLELMDLGYGFEMLEGDYYLTIDYDKFYKTFGDAISDELNVYYDLMKRESTDPSFVEEYLNISVEEIADRAMTLETFIKQHPDFIFRETSVDWLTWYINGLLRVDVFSGSVDYETGFVSDKLKSVYKSVLASDVAITKAAVEDMMKVIESCEGIIKMDDQKANDAVNAIKNDYYGKVKILVDEYYPAE